MFKDKEFSELIANGPEIRLYFVIDELGAFLWRIRHDMADGRIATNDTAGINRSLDEAREQQRQTIEQCVRFSVETPTDSDGLASEDYWRWYRWWDNWKQGLSDDEWNVLDVVLSQEGGLTDEDIQKYRPSGSWLEPTSAPSGGRSVT